MSCTEWRARLHIFRKTHGTSKTSFSFNFDGLFRQNLAYAHKTSDVIARLRGEDVVRDPAIRQTRKAENQERERASKIKADQIFNRSNMGPEAAASGSKHEKVICVQGLPGTFSVSRAVDSSSHNDLFDANTDLLFSYFMTIDATTCHMLELLFQQFNGFREAQVSGERPITGLVRFDSAGNAAIALRGLQGFRLNSTHALHLSLVDSY